LDIPTLQAQIDFHKLIDDKCLSKIGKFSDELIDLLKGILVKDPVQRMTFKQIMDHPWFAGFVPLTLSTRIDVFD
tara:strand:+ start:421 stop:645 length:225 start_codon:yes stop_codon:yes gene_type:complete